MKSFSIPVAVLAAAGLAACASAPASQAPPGRVAATADRALAAQASAFESFVRRAGGIDASFSGPADVREALQTGASSEPRQLEAGMVAYAAMAALQEPRFVASVRASKGDLAARLAANPTFALTLPGGEAAAARAAGALHQQGRALVSDGQKIKRASYAVQRQAWSKGDAGGRPRLERVKRISATGYQPAGDDTARLFHALAEGERRSGQASPLVARATALAALSAMGQRERGRTLLSDARTGSCLRIAKLNLYQCLAAAGPHYEDVYCLGQHAMMETGQCVVDATKPGHSLVIRTNLKR